MQNVCSSWAQPKGCVSECFLLAETSHVGSRDYMVSKHHVALELLLLKWKSPGNHNTVPALLPRASPLCGAGKVHLFSLAPTALSTLFLPTLQPCCFWTGTTGCSLIDWKYHCSPLPLFFHVYIGVMLYVVAMLREELGKLMIPGQSIWHCVYFGRLRPRPMWDPALKNLSIFARILSSCCQSS